MGEKKMQKTILWVVKNSLTLIIKKAGFDELSNFAISIRIPTPKSRFQNPHQLEPDRANEYFHEAAERIIRSPEDFSLPVYPSALNKKKNRKYHVQ